MNRPATSRGRVIRPLAPKKGHEIGEAAASGQEADALSPGLYIVAGPIGNLQDLSPRAARWLRCADLIACEDTRVTAKLLRAAGSDRPMQCYHDHSAPDVAEALLARMAREAVALVSDAGTPLISDPGYGLVRAARSRGIVVTTAPGPCAAIAALSLSGLPSDRFLFAGFLPPRPVARRRALAELAGLRATLIFYESGPRLAAMLADGHAMLGAREAVVARELTKLHETVESGTLAELAARFAAAEPAKGEIVVLIGPGSAAVASGADAVETALSEALKSMKMGQAVASVSAALGAPRDDVYALALRLKGKA